MELAFKEAEKAFKCGEVPVGAVIVKNGKIIAKTHNKKEKTHCAVNHAEILAIKLASRKLRNWRLEDCDIYITLEPCVMCTGAIIQARIKNVYYGAKNKRYGCHESAINLFDVEFNHKVNVVGGILEEEWSLLISSFFKELRNRKE